MADNFKDLELSDGSKPLDPNKNDFFLVTITDLLPGKTYPVEFRWNYSDPAKKGDWGAVLNITTPAEAPDAPVISTVAWPNEIFTLTFTHDRSLGQNSNVLFYKIRIIAADSTERVFYHSPKTGSTQIFTLEYSKIVEAFGIPLFAFSGAVIAVDKNGNESIAATFPLTTASTSLPTPVITVSAAIGGYTVSYTTPSATTYPNYSHINIEEVESSAGSDPGTGYSVVFSGVANPVVLSRSGSAQRWVRARFISKLGLPGAYSTAFAVTPTPAVVVDTIAPSAPASGSLSAGIDNTSGATIGFNAFIDVSWNAVSDSTLRGYRIRFRRDGSSDPYSYVDSPGTGTTFRLSGLAIGTTYEIAVASYDEINNTSSSYTSLGTATATGTPFIGKNVTTQGYFGASATGDTGEFRFGYGVESGRRGLRFDSNNYWYIDSSAAASFRLGGSVNNYLQWNGSTFTIDGNLVARSGEFRGNVQIVSGSLYAGASASSGARLAISSTGLTAYDANGTATTNIYGNANAGGVTFDTIAGTIGNWSITNSSITKTQGNGTLTLNSSNARITASGTTAAYVVGMAAPTNNAPSDIVLYAGSSTPASAPFRVRADGAVTMTSATITGYVGAADVANNIGGVGITTITGDKVRTGSIEGNNYSYISGNFSSQGTQIDLTNNRIRSPKFAVDGGNAYFAGDISIIGSSVTTSISSSTGIISINDASAGGLYGGGINISNSSRSSTLGGSGLSWTEGSNTGAVYIASGTVNLKAGSAQSVSITADDGLNRAAYPIYMNGHVAILNAMYIGDSSSSETSLADGVHISTGRIALKRNTTPLFLHRTDGGTGPLRVATFYSGGVLAGGINVFTNQAAQFVNPSDYRLKENIQDYIGAMSIIKKARLRQFNFKNDPETTLIGFIAHEFADVDPKFVIGEKDAIDEDGNPVYQEMMVNAIVPYLIGALKESIIKIEELEQRLDALEG